MTRTPFDRHRIGGTAAAARLPATRKVSEAMKPSGYRPNSPLTGSGQPPAYKTERHRGNARFPNRSQSLSFQPIFVQTAFREAYPNYEREVSLSSVMSRQPHLLDSGRYRRLSIPI
jgi:hypothetical protein